MGIEIPRCESQADVLNCPTKSDVDTWHSSGVFGKVSHFWGHTSVAMPGSDYPEVSCEELYANDADLRAQHCQ